MKRIYQRSQVLSYHELTEQQQIVANDLYDNCHNYKFVLWNDEPVNLGDFEVLPNSKLWHGTAMLSAFSGYYIRLNKSNEWATVVYAHW